MKTTPVTLKSTGFNPQKGKKNRVRAARPSYLEQSVQQHGKGASLRGGAPSIELYQSESCSVSHSVRNRLSLLGLDFVAHSVPDHNDLKHRQLVQAGGKDQIPFLIDHRSGVKLYEGDAILAYLDKEYGKPASGGIAGIARRLETEIRGRADRIAWTVAQPWSQALELRRSLVEAGASLKATWGELRSAFSRSMS